MGHSKFGIAIVGLGLISKTHADAYKRLPDLVGEVVGCDIDPGARERFASEFQCRTLTDLQQVIADPNIDIVDLILPHHLHYEAAMAVLDAGKHLIIEKPVAGTYREALAICDRARDVGVHFMVAENTRYIAAYVAVEKLLRSGVIGEVVHARTFLRSNEKDHLSQQGYWRTKYAMGGGLVMDTGAHSFYLLKWLLGDFDNVVGTSTKVFPLDNEIEDTAEVQGRLKSGAHFSCGFTSVSEIPHSERLELYGTRGGIVVDQMAEPVVKLFGGHQDFKGVPIDGVAFGPDAWHPGGWHYESVITEVTDYVQSLAEGRAPLIDSYDCAYAMRVVEAAYASIGSSKPVSLRESTVAGR